MEAIKERLAGTAYRSKTRTGFSPCPTFLAKRKGSGPEKKIGVEAGFFNLAEKSLCNQGLLFQETERGKRFTLLRRHSEAGIPT